MLRCLLVLAAWAAAAGTGPAVRVETVATGFDRPVGVKFDASGGIYVIEQTGRVRLIEDGRAAKEPFLDISDRSFPFKYEGEERGLLDIEFAPDYARSGRFFVHYDDKSGNTVLSEFRARGGRGDPASERILFTQKQPYPNHKGGQIAFGPDGRLYLGLGDGGSAGDPHKNAQNKSVNLGKLLRIDVSTFPAAVQIWAYGLRNPWRFSFDRGLIYIGDVGQNRWEEVDVEPASQGGLNYGWNILEGLECYGADTCDRTGLTPPVLTYKLYVRGDCAVIGGYVYRGKSLPRLDGLYFYSDYCSGVLRSFRYKDGQAAEKREWPELNPDHKYWEQVSSLGRDGRGEIYLVGYDTGVLCRLAAPK